MPGLQFSQSTDLAIHGLWALALLETGRFVLLSDIAHRQNVSESYLAKVFQRLTHAGITRAMRGKRGGYALARPPEAITIGMSYERWTQSPRCISAWPRNAAVRPRRTVCCCASLRKLNSTCTPCSTGSPWPTCSVIFCVAGNVWRGSSST